MKLEDLKKKLAFSEYLNFTKIFSLEFNNIQEKFV